MLDFTPSEIQWLAVGWCWAQRCPTITDSVLGIAALSTNLHLGNALDYFDCRCPACGRI